MNPNNPGMANATDKQAARTTRGLGRVTSFVAAIHIVSVTAPKRNT
jgi:hypothetical protein